MVGLLLIDVSDPNSLGRARVHLLSPRKALFLESSLIISTKKLREQRMTKRSQKLLLTFFLIVLAIIVFDKVVLRAWDSIDAGNIELRGAPDPFKADLASMIGRYQMGEVEVVDISAVTTFSWQRLYIFSPYTTLSKITDTVGRSWRKKCYTDIETSEIVNLLVFTDEKTVVHCLDFPTNVGSFSYPEPAFLEGLTPQEARFTVDKSNYLIWVGNK
jgi:hypothetical protein